ncbi:glycosyl hydrolase family 3 N terminal domain-containing protein [Xylariales sp. PMI_506]|nr:glycosyl hydrolase family 3 N terminal domain-containing protein [Xylariales sp. PMI_506]
MFDVETVIREASSAEKVSLLAGKDFWHTVPLPRFNVPSIRMSDGPNGVRGTQFFAGVAATCIPCGTALGATWDLDLLRQAGVLIGQECKVKGAHCWLGPTVNMQRSPLGGRGFESFSEDPVLSGKIAGSYITGAQSTGVVSTLKHWVANDQEHERMAVDARVSDRALREIYMKPFQIAIKEGNPGAIMTSYNKLNGTHVSESKEYIDILREEWGWKGLVVSDWFGTYSTSEALNAGLDLEMPGETRWRGILADMAVSSRKVTDDTIDSRVRNVLEFVKHCSEIEGISPIEGIRDTMEDRALNRKLMADSVVLLKNDDNILPLPAADITDIALIGPNFKNVAYCGGGSAQLEPHYIVSAYDGIVDQLTNGGERKDVKIHYEVGAASHGFLPVLDDNMAAPEGEEGLLRIRFYCDPPSVPNREIIDQYLSKGSIWQLAGFGHPRLGKTFWADVECTYTPIETTDYNWGVASFGTTSLYIDGNLTVDNTTNQKAGNAFFGKGSTMETAVVAMEAGRKYNIKVEFGSSTLSKLVKRGVVSYGGGAGRIGCLPVIQPEESIRRAADLAKRCKYTIVCAGLNKDWESEGFDRADMDLPGTISKLITSVLDANPQAIIITQSGTPISMQPWISKSSTQVHMWYGGNELGNGLADVLFGKVNPSGKLPLTFPRVVEDTPSFLNFESERGRVVYGEGVFVGYRYYEKLKKNVAYPFGHGLSYTKFALSSLSIEQNSVAFVVENTGAVAGACVAQLYISPARTNTISRPVKELQGFAKVFLQPDESKKVIIELDQMATSFWDEIKKTWVSEKGIYGVHIGQSSEEIELNGELVVEETTAWRGL